jgi:3D (Asp-Asp-Asp) domain-containing protein
MRILPQRMREKHEQAPGPGCSPGRAFLLAGAFLALTSGAGCGGRIHPVTAPTAQPIPSASPAFVAYTATAYCTGHVTASGSRVVPGTVAADPALLPLGTVIRVQSLDPAYDGTYTVMDTGANIRGRRIDVYIPNCAEAVRFGRRPARVAVLQRVR